MNDTTAQLIELCAELRVAVPLPRGAHSAHDHAGVVQRSIGEHARPVPAA